MIELYTLWKLRHPIQLVGTWKVTARFPIEGPSGDFFDCITVQYIRTEARRVILCKCYKVLHVECVPITI